MRVDLITKEYPPRSTAAPGCTSTELVRALRPRATSTCACAASAAPGDEAGTHAYSAPAELGATANAGAADPRASTCAMARRRAGADLVHSHTWYANCAGHLASLLHGIPHVVTAHSLEPLRPWKAEQLGGGYRVSRWIEKTAYEARGCRDRGERRHAPRHPAPLPRRRSRRRCTSSTTASTSSAGTPA